MNELFALNVCSQLNAIQCIQTAHGPGIQNKSTNDAQQSGLWWNMYGLATVTFGYIYDCIRDWYGLVCVFQYEWIVRNGVRVPQQFSVCMVDGMWVNLNVFIREQFKLSHAINAVLERRFDSPPFNSFSPFLDDTSLSNWLWFMLIHVLFEFEHIFAYSEHLSSSFVVRNI